MKNWSIKLPKALCIASITCFLQFQASAGVVKLVDILSNETGLVEKLSKFGIKGESASKVKSYVNNSIASLYKFNNARPTAKELKQFINELQVVSNKDKKYKASLLQLLSRPEKEISEEDFIKAVNSLIYLANRHGKNSAAVLACTACVSDSLSARGFEFTLETMNNAKSKEVLSKLLPSNPRSLTNYINTKLGKYKIGDLSRSGTLVLPEEEKALGLFLGLKEIGTKEQKNLISSIENISKDSSGKINILSTKNPHKLWKIFSEDLSESEMVGWTKLLDEVAEKSSDKIEKKSVFFEILEKRARSNPDLQERVQTLKNKNCFFK